MLPPPARIEPVPGTPFGIVYLTPPTEWAGMAVGSLVAGIGSILVATIVGCFGLAGSSGGWGPLVGGAFALLAVFLGLASIWLGLTGLRRVTRSGGQVKGRGLAIAGISCGGSGLLLTVIAFLTAVAIVQ
jgi:hypothetical protein